MSEHRKKIEKIFITCILTVFMGQIYLNPFTSQFRFSFSVVILSLLLIHFKNVSVIALANSVGISIYLFRSFVYMVGHPGAMLSETTQIYYPVAIFYILYGVLFELLDVRNKLDKPEMFIAAMWFCDSISNIIEVVLRRENLAYAFEEVTLAIILIGAMRAILTLGIYYLTAHYKNRYDREQKENKYREIILFIASLKTELFFLRKSIMDIETAMNRSYSLYEKIEDTALRDDALLVAKDIHEIKKDYNRVIGGMEKTLQEESNHSHMSIKEIFQIIYGNTQKLIEVSNKNIILILKHKNNFETQEYYPLISILNNLIVNAMESMGEDGTIIVRQEIEGNRCTFSVIDNGSGIEPEDVEVVFEPGFSTKFNPMTGEMSTGIGLTHVKHIIENHFNGKIDVASQKNVETVFRIQIPVSKIVWGER